MPLPNARRNELVATVINRTAGEHRDQRAVIPVHELRFVFAAL